MTHVQVNNHAASDRWPELEKWGEKYITNKESNSGMGVRARPAHYHALVLPCVE